MKGFILLALAFLHSGRSLRCSCYVHKLVTHFLVTLLIEAEVSSETHVFGFCYDHLNHFYQSDKKLDLIFTFL